MLPGFQNEGFRCSEVALSDDRLLAVAWAETRHIQLIAVGSCLVLCRLAANPIPDAQRTELMGIAMEIRVLAGGNTAD